MIPRKLCGIYIPGTFEAENVISAMRYRPRPDDLFLATFPKCGTTWTEQILLLLFDSQPPVSRLQRMSRVLPIEITGAKAVEDMQKPGAIRTHLPLRLVQWSDEAKYIYVARNPKDCCVSMYYYTKTRGLDLSFDDFFEKFLTGDTIFGDYFDHLMEWYEKRNKPNVLYLTYECMKENPKESILKMASFIDDERYGKPLRDDPEKINAILKYSTFDYMKKVFTEMDDSRNREVYSKFAEGNVSQGLEEILGKVYDKVDKLGVRVSTVTRKGVVGDWRNHFSEDQNKRLNEKFQTTTKDTHLFTLWKDYI